MALLRSNEPPNQISTTRKVIGGSLTIGGLGMAGYGLAKILKRK